MSLHASPRAVLLPSVCQTGTVGMQIPVSGFPAVKDLIGLSWIDWFSLGPIEGGHTGGVGTQVGSGVEVWKVPGCPQGF